jgi:hypothetical protein
MICRRSQNQLRRWWGHEGDHECPLQHIHITILDLAW